MTGYPGWPQRGGGGGDGIPETLIDAKGDLIVGTAADTADVLPAGTDTFILVADSAEPSGLLWRPPQYSWVEVAASLFSATAGAAVNADDVFDGTYRDYMVIIECTMSTADGLLVRLRKSGTDASTNYINRVTANDSSLSNNGGATITTAFRHTAAANFGSGVYRFNRPFVSGPTVWSVDFVAEGGGGCWSHSGGGIHTTSDAYDGFSLVPGGSYNIAGQYRVFGLYEAP